MNLSEFSMFITDSSVRMTCKSQDYFEWNGDCVANRSTKSGLAADGTIRVPGRLRTPKEARRLLEELRTAYQSLTTPEQRGVRSFMSELLDSQRRFGSTCGDRDSEVSRTSSEG